MILSRLSVPSVSFCSKPVSVFRGKFWYQNLPLNSLPAQRKSLSRQKIQINIMQFNEPKNSLQNSTPFGPLPKMESYEHALALARERHDDFLPRAFQIRQWLADCVIETCAAYANPHRRPGEPMQTGGVLSAFLDVFDLRRDDQLLPASQALFRFLKYSHPLSDVLARSRAPLHIEHDVTGDYSGRRTLHLAKNPATAVPLLRRSLERWCDWLDAINHLEVHRSSQLALAGFEPTKADEFVAFGFNLCKLPNPETPSSPLNWLWRHDTPPAIDLAQLAVLPSPSRGEGPEPHIPHSAFLAAPNPASAGEGGRTPHLKTWPNEEVDTLLIALQPVAKQYAWSCADLLKVLRKLVRNPAVFPLWHESDLEYYRKTELALPPLAAENFSENPLPAAFDLALALCPLPDSRRLGEPPWS